MQWDSTIINDDSYGQAISNLDEKEKLAELVATKVKHGEIIGVGSGSTSYLAVLAIARRVKDEGLLIKAIPSSIEISLVCIKMGLPLTNLYEYRPDWYFDGADEVDPNLDMIKGRGGAMFREKLLMRASPVNYILADQTKLVDCLGTNFAVPVEVFPSALPVVEAGLKAIGAHEILLRPAINKDGPVITESGNLILDVRFKTIDRELEKNIKSITGVIESGLFQNHRAELLVAR